MTDMQLLTLAVTLLGIFVASWFNNSRIGDVNSRIGDVSQKIDRNIDTVNRQIDDLSQKVDYRVGDLRDVLRAEMNLQFERMNNKLDVLLKMMADIDQRLTTASGI